jgi:hypothetical protein
MKIIEIGVCIDNNDPRGFGRIRTSNIDEIDSTRSNAMPSWNGVPWSKNDPFICTPFLPNHINVIPKIQQAVKIIRYDAEKGLQNQEYIAGPFTTPHDYGSQKSEQQLSETTFGQATIKTPDIKSFAPNSKTFTDGSLRAESVGSIPKVDDISISGNYGSDIILTEHGVQLRAGNLIDKLTAKPEQKDDLTKYPMFSKKHSKISLKKFPETVVLDFKEFKENVITRTDIKHVFEYGLNDLINPTEVLFQLYSIKQNFGEKYKTDVFGVDTELEVNTTTLIYEKTIELTSTTINEKKQEAYILIRDFISKLDLEKLNKIDATLVDTYAHPFYFRPKASFKNITGSASFLEKIIYSDRITSGLIFSLNSSNVPIKTVTKKNPYLKKVSDVNQTFGAITADTIIQLSQTNPGVNGKQIDFSSLDRYEYTQEDYLTRILPNTFSTVRGEKLIEILELITLILLNHKHGILTPTKYPAEAVGSLEKLIKRAKQDMVNNSIRIN